MNFSFCKSKLTPSHVIFCVGTHKDLSLFTTKHNCLRECFKNNACFIVVSLSLVTPAPSSIKQEIFIACSLQYFTSTHIVLVKIKGAEVSPKGRTVKTKYFTLPRCSQENPIFFVYFVNLNMMIPLLYIKFKQKPLFNNKIFHCFPVIKFDFILINMFIHVSEI